MGGADLRKLPSVERLAQQVEERATGTFPRSLIVACARDVVDAARTRLVKHEHADVTVETLAAEVEVLLQRRSAATLIRAVNATGIVLHTNLGRAPLSDRARAAVADAASGYSTLETDPDAGGRGSRQQHLEPLLVQVTGAEAGIAVNNNAAAVLLALSALARGREVIVSRGELVEIGGTFRLPEVMAQSDAVLVEVGTTNRTYAYDYERAITSNTALLLKVHRSNFVMDGFVHETSAGDLIDLGRRQGIPVMYDVGSGCLVDLRTRGLPYEPTVPEAIRAGCDVVTFSGDKLLGGPQAGIIVGRAAHLERVRAHPLARAMRMDKLDVAALAATLQAYLDPERVWQNIPVLKMLATPLDELRAAAERMRGALAGRLPSSWRVDLVPTTAEVGGGSLPEAHLPSFALAIRTTFSLDRLESALRTSTPPIFARISQDMILLDMRTLLTGDEETIIDAFSRNEELVRT